VLHADELRFGVNVNLVQLVEAPDLTLVAWLEEAHGRELDFDALAARPAKGAWFGLSHQTAERRTIQLKRSKH
jgi:aryl carrier-like protein